MTHKPLRSTSNKWTMRSQIRMERSSRKTQSRWQLKLNLRRLLQPPLWPRTSSLRTTTRGPRPRASRPRSGSVVATRDDADPATTVTMDADDVDTMDRDVATGQTRQPPPPGSGDATHPGLGASASGRRRTQAPPIRSRWPRGRDVRSTSEACCGRMLTRRGSLKPSTVPSKRCQSIRSATAKRPENQCFRCTIPKISSGKQQ
mmetsp:Transcript_15074/g.25617  ORF Transcript_15074/g.25617 Transcript_15074/m.25617 type:complete len:203 (-) Transcript_15074:1676-2284(-)